MAETKFAARSKAMTFTSYNPPVPLLSGIQKADRISHGLIRQYLRNYGVIPIKGVTPFLYLSGFFRFFLFYSFHCINKLLLCWDVK